MRFEVSLPFGFALDSLEVFVSLFGMLCVFLLLQSTLTSPFAFMTATSLYLF